MCAFYYVQSLWELCCKELCPSTNISLFGACTSVHTAQDPLDPVLNNVINLHIQQENTTMPSFAQAGAEA